VLWIFRAISTRLKALFVSDVALDFEAEFVARQADRKAELLRKADALANEGLESVAADLRQRAETLSLDKPLASVSAAIAELGHQAANDAIRPRLDAAADDSPSGKAARGRLVPAANKKTARKKRSAR